MINTLGHMTNKQIFISIFYLLLLVTVPPIASASSEGIWEPAPMSVTDYDALSHDLRVHGDSVFIESTPYRSEGILEGCGYAYTAVLLDWAYNNNQPIMVNGSVLYFLEANSTPHLALRIGIVNLQKKENQVFSRNESVNYSYLSFGFENTAGKEKAILDGAHKYKNFAYVDDDLEMLSKLRSDNFSIFFNRTDKGTDLEIKIKVEDKEHLNYLMCSGMLVKQAYDRF